MKIRNSESGMALLTVMITVATLIGALYYMYDKVKFTTNAISKIQKQSKSSYAMKGILAYAKDLLASRVCIDETEQTGLPTSKCQLTDKGSLERLLLSRNVNEALCRYYKNNPFPDGLQNYCGGTGKPKLYLSTFNFNIKASFITAQHPLYVLFDKLSDYSLDAACLNIKYDSATSSLHSTMANTTTVVTAYKDESCTGEVISQAQSLDVFYPRQVGEFALISNRSISIGDSGAESDLNSIDGSKNIIFQSPIFINKNFYIPDSGAASNRKIIFQDRVFIGGGIRSLSNNYVEPVPVDTGELWLSRYPHFQGMQKGLVRTTEERSLTRMFHPSLAPANDASLMEQCNEYNKGKAAKPLCKGKISDLPKLLVEKEGPQSYSFALSAKSEFVAKDIKSPLPSGVTYVGPLPIEGAVNQPPTAKLEITVKLGLGFKVYVSPGTGINIDMLKTGMLSWNHPSPCKTIGTKQFCYINNEVVEKTLSNIKLAPLPPLPPKIVVKGHDASGEVTPPEDAFKNTEDTNKTNDSYESVELVDCIYDPGPKKWNCKEETTTADVDASNPLALPQLKFRPTVATRDRVLNFNIDHDPIDPILYKYKNNDSILDLSLIPLDLCQVQRTSSVDDMQIELKTNEFLGITQPTWTRTDGDPITLTPDEIAFIDGDNSLFEKCSNASLPATGYASYDADWSEEAFNSWNFNPVDKKGQYKPTAAKTGYDKIFNLSDPTVTNKIEIDDTNSNLLHSYSILDRCIIKKEATIVKGFLGCRYLVIEDRSKDLEMIGSFIVDKMTIGQMGSSKLYWKNIYHPSARSKLVHTADDGVANSLPSNHQLKPLASCVTNKALPAWASLETECDPASLTEKAVPFTWTTFDPLCVIRTESPVPLCKPEDRAYNLNIVKIFEHFGI